MSGRKLNPEYVSQAKEFAMIAFKQLMSGLCYGVGLKIASRAFKVGNHVAKVLDIEDYRESV
jgi:hypothetical protein